MASGDWLNVVASGGSWAVFDPDDRAAALREAARRADGAEEAIDFQVPADGWDDLVRANPHLLIDDQRKARPRE